MPAVEGRAFRHGASSARRSESRGPLLRRVGVGRHGCVQGSGRTRRFAATGGRDGDGHPLHRSLRRQLTEPSHPSPGRPGGARLRDDRLREGAAARNDQLNRPDVLNAFDFRMLREIARAARTPPGTTRSASSSSRARAAPSASAPTCAPGRRAPREAAGVLEVVRRLQGHARPVARDRQADDRAHQRDRRRGRQRAADGVRSRGDRRRRLHPPRRARARLRARGRRDAVAAAHGRRASRARDRPALRRDPGAAGGRMGAREPRGARRRSSTPSSTSGSRASSASCHRRRAMRSNSSTSGATWRGTRRSATRATGSRSRCSATRRRARSRSSSTRGGR